MLFGILDRWIIIYMFLNISMHLGEIMSNMEVLNSGLLIGIGYDFEGQGHRIFFCLF